MIKFAETDFEKLEEVYHINHKDKNFYYKSIRNENRAKKLTLEVKERISETEQVIKNVEYFGKGFVIGSCHRKKRGEGKYRENLWVWVVNETAYNRIRSKIGKPAPYQTFIPQLEFSVSGWGAALAEVWLENFALKNYREKLIRVLERTKLNRSNYYLGVETDDGVYQEFSFTDRNMKLFKSLLFNKNAYKAGVVKWLPKESIQEKNITRSVISSLKELNEKVYSKLFDSSNAGVAKQYFKVPRRKPSGKTDVSDYFKKGSKGTKVTLKHRKIQDDLIALYKEQYGHPDEATVTKEPDYIDIKIAGRGFEYIYEIKTSDNPVTCIRQALGQILYYLWSQKIPESKEVKLIIVGMKDLPVGAESYFKFVKEKLDIEIEYDSVENLLKGKIY